MSIKILFSPFSQKYLLNSMRASSHRLVLDCDLHWHWGVRKDDLFADIAREFTSLSQAPFELYSSSSDCIVQIQPTWNMEECQNFDLHDCWRSRMHDGFEARERSSHCENWRIQNLAYYSPAHIHPCGSYGIHLSKRGIAKVAKQVHQFCPNESLEIIQMATIYMLFAHEMCHSWIEDICSLSDFSIGENQPKNERQYAKVNNHFCGYIFMEEAICNTAAYGWLHEFLCNSAYNDEMDPLPSFDCDIILDSFSKWMRAQPAGYKNFIEIKCKPHENLLFLKNLARLLIEIYKINSEIYYTHMLTEIFDSFFSINLTPDFKHLRTKITSYWNSLCFGDLPLYIEE